MDELGVGVADEPTGVATNFSKMSLQAIHYCLPVVELPKSWCEVVVGGLDGLRTGVLVLLATVAVSSESELCVCVTAATAFVFVGYGP